ncbi:uncharacterized protein PV09_01687 [Verruconis gallopava]|uniref:Uncharacterized protein n=1 Tax=Verruconis gallopava TaxID=253628 RepID=A0A0D2B925_9PEZI|nr:uncharacterized protein PV09_01687 [Verruconis gallopava]KIW07759.1 hypothetical protein PV09_01687 [Verruconis gallopava]
MEEDIFTWLLEEFKVHPKFVESLYYFLGNFSTFVTYSKADESPESFHIVVKVFPAGHLEGAFYIRYDFKTRKALVIIAGNDLSGHIEYQIEQLSRLREDWHPFGMAFCIISRYYFYLEWQRGQLDHSVIMMERVTGRGAIAYLEANVTQPDNPDSFNLRNMHWIGGNQRNMIYAMEFQIRLTTFIYEAHIQFVTLSLGRSEHPPLSHQDLPIQDRSLQEAFKAHIVSCKGVFEDSRVIGERAQSQLNAADSIINTLIAKQSQRIADESKTIAVETRRDSTSMKTIAGLTMVYLPSTFIATIFSTGFFRFTSDSSSAQLVVNNNIWKFICICLLFTIITVVVWVYLNRYGVPKLIRHKEDGKKATDLQVEPPVILLDLPQIPGHRARRLLEAVYSDDNSKNQVDKAPDREAADSSRAAEQNLEEGTKMMGGEIV